MYWKIPKDLFDELPEDVQAKIEDGGEYIDAHGDEAPEPEGDADADDSMPPEKDKLGAHEFKREGPDDIMKPMSDKEKNKVKDFDDASEKGLGLMIAIGGKPKAKKDSKKKPPMDDEGY